MIVEDIRSMFYRAAPERALLLGLLAVDAVFFVGHVGLHLLGAEGYFDPIIEQAAGEGVQYLKWIWAAMLCWMLPGVLPGARLWSFFLGVLFVDDSLSFHERVGRAISEGYFDGTFGSVNPEGLGENLFYLVLCLIVGIVFAESLRQSRGAPRRNLYTFVALLGLLFCFAGLVDVVDTFIWNSPFEYTVEIIEDHGEMAVLSLLTAWLYGRWVTSGRSAPSPADHP